MTRADELAANLKKKLAEVRRQGEERMAQRLANRLGLSYLDAGKAPVSLDAVAMVPEETAKAAGLAVIQKHMKRVVVAAVDPSREEAKRVLEDLKKKGYEVKVFVASLSGIQHVWEQYQHVAKKKATSITGKVVVTSSEKERLFQQFHSLPDVTKAIADLGFTKLDTSSLLNIVVLGALATRASDIHLEAGEDVSKLRYRVDGILYDIFDQFPKKHYRALISRIKLLSELKINVTTEPQDGRFAVVLPEKEIDMRVSVIPSEFGETVVMRILDPDSINLGLEDLGLREDNLRIVKSAIERPNGLILNTGPTGSGKTTTLYTFLRYLNSPEVKIITVEDPIEYHLKGVQQTQVDPDVGYTFASGLRSILRQDPDVILVGEIRDLETGEIAIQAALTGHLVLSTLHTNDAVGTILRLTDLKIRPVSIAPALSLAIAQRLVRRLCEKCKVPQEVSPERKEAIAAFLDQLPSRVNRAPYQQYTIYGPSEKGCEACGGLGYKGRAAVFEFLENTPEIQEATLRGDSKARLTEIARKGGMVMMQEDGILKVLEGITTFEEVEDATGAIQWEAFLQKKNRLESGGNG